MTAFRVMVNGDFSQDLRVIVKVKDELFMRCVECEEELMRIVATKEEENTKKLHEVKSGGWLEQQRRAIAIAYLTLADVEARRYRALRKDYFENLQLGICASY